MRRVAVHAAALCAMAAALLAAPGAALGAEATSPLLLQSGVGLWEQYRYDPFYTRNVPSFDPDGAAYIRHRTADPDMSTFVHTPTASGWARLDFTGALAAAYPTFAGTVGAGGRASDRVVFDRLGRAYNSLTIRLADGSTRNVLLISWDRCRSWRAYELPQGSVALEHWVGHNEIDGPPLVGVWRPAPPSSSAPGQRFTLLVTQPRLEGEQLVVPEPVHVTDDCLGEGAIFGGSSFAVTKGGRTFFVWTAATPEGSEGAPTYAASFDPSSGAVSAPSLVAVSPGANDTHNRPAVAVDSHGVLHVVTGTHGTPALYSHSLAPLTTDGGWSEPEPALTTGWETTQPGVARGCQTYPGLVCDGEDTLHLVTRQWRRTAEEALAKQYRGALIHQSRPAGGAWSEPHTLALAPDPGYCSFQHKVALDSRDRLFVACTFVGAEDVWRSRSALAEAMVLGRGASGVVPSRRRMVLISEDAGAAWRLASDTDFGVAAPFVARGARGAAAPPRLAWWWASRKPQGDQITAIRFVENRYGWAVGTRGTILRSVDGGAHWRRQSSGTRSNLFGVAATGRDTAWAVGSGGVIVKTTDGGRHWRRLASGTTETLFAISAVSGRVAWVAGQRGTLRRTLDGGRSWQRRSAGTQDTLFAICFVDARRGWIGGGWLTSGAGRIAATIDGGAHWTRQGDSTLGLIHGLAFRTASNGLAVGAGGAVFGTRDGGRTWTAASTPGNDRLNAVRYASPLVAFASGDGGAMLKTRDGGLTWARLTLAGANTRGGLAASSRFVWLGGRGGRLLRSGTQGRTWRDLTSGFSAHIRALVAEADGAVWAAGGHGLLARREAGQSQWARFPLGTSADLNDLALLGRERWAVGESGVVARSADGGASWTLRAITSASLRAVAAVGQGRAWVAGDQGMLAATHDGGATWRSADAGGRADFTCLAFSDALHGWVGGGGQDDEPAVVLRTEDGGASWLPCPVPVRGRVHDLRFASPLTGWAAAEDWGPDGDRAQGVILATTDGGATWTVQARTGVPLRSLAFADGLHGLAVGAAGRTLRTADGGATWSQADAGTVNNLFAAALLGPTSAWVAGEDGTLLAGRAAP